MAGGVTILGKKLVEFVRSFGFANVSGVPLNDVLVGGFNPSEKY